MNPFKDRLNRCKQLFWPVPPVSWQPDQNRGALEILGFWADTWLALESHVPKKNRLVKKDFRFPALLGDCVFRINLFNGELEKKWRDMPGRLDDGNDYPGYARYLAFHNNRVISRVGQCFFRHSSLPQYSNFPFAMVNEQIFELGRVLWEGPSSGPKDFKGYRFYLARYCYLLGLLHGFLYDSFSGAGVFLTFDYDAMHFARLKGRLGAMLHAVDSEYSLRRFIHQVRPVLLTSHLKKKGVPPAPGFELKPARICEQFVHVSGTDPVSLEPLTWHLADVLYAVDGQLGDSLEYASREIQSSGQQPLVDLVCRFTKQSLALFARMYGGNTNSRNLEDQMHYGEWFDLEDRFLSQWLELIHPNGSRVDPGGSKRGPCTVEGVTGRMNRKAGAWPRKPLDPAQGVSGGKDNNGQKTVPDLNPEDFSPGDLRLETIIERRSPEQMDLIFQHYACLGEICHGRVPDILMGIGGSGVFLAHMTNWMQQTDIPVCLFQTFPYMGFQPQSVILLSRAVTDRTGRVVICAGSMKTLFTFSALDAHLRQKNLRPCIMEIWPFSLHRNHETVETGALPVVRPLFTTGTPGKKGVTLNLPAASFRSRCPAVPVWPDPDSENGGLAGCLTVDELSDPVRIDYTRIIADTRATVSLARKFAQNIRDRIKDAGPAFVFSPSPGGRVLALAAGYFLRHMGVDVRFVTSLQAAAEAESWGKSNTFLIDLTRVTGFTADYAWQTLTDRPWDSPITIDDLMHPLLGSGFPYCRY